MIEQVSNCVKIHDTLIPAVNIQVNEFFEDGSPMATYFEIMFEDGALWVVDGDEEDHNLNYILVEVHDKWGRIADINQIDHCYIFLTWAQFLDKYKTKLGDPKDRLKHWYSHPLYVDRIVD